MGGSISNGCLPRSAAKGAIRRVVACGRGRDINAPLVRDAIVTMARQASGKNDSTSLSFVYIGAPSFEKTEAMKLQTYGFSAVGCNVEHLHMTELSTAPSSAEMRSAIEKADIIAVSGGNTLFGIARWRRLGVDKMLRDAWKRGAIMCGGSAGAICWFHGGHSDSLDPTTVLNQKETLTDEEKASWSYVRVAGLGFIPGLCCPHHDQVQSNGVLRATDFDRMLTQNPAEVGICIDNNAAFIIEGDRWRVLSTGVWEHGEKGGGVQRKIFENGSIVAQPLECDDTLRPMADLFMLPDFTHLP